MPGTRSRRNSWLLVLVLGLVAALPAGASAPAISLPCKPGSGPNFAERKVTVDQLRAPADVRCGNFESVDLQEDDLSQIDFTGADFRYAKLGTSDLSQANFTGANLTGADLDHATLDQATLSYATFDKADLSHAKMIQVTADHASFVGANVSNVDMTQATLTDADLDHSNLGGTDFTQAELGGATFHGATGLTPWGLIVLIIAGVVFAALLARLIRKATSSGNNAGPGTLATGLAGALIVAVGVHLTVGGFVDLVAGAFGGPIEQTCNTGPLCTIGVQSGFLGAFGGIFAIIGGFVVMATSKS